MPRSSYVSASAQAGLTEGPRSSTAARLDAYPTLVILLDPLPSFFWEELKWGNRGIVESRAVPKFV